MKTSFLIASVGMIGFACLSFAPVASADEVTTKTTTTKTSEPPAVVVDTPAPAGAVVEDSGGCATKKVTKSNDAGDTKTKTTTNCD